MNDYTMEELFPIVADLSVKYTSGESSSITQEKARQLMGAVQYTVRVYELSASIPNAPATEKKLSAREAYRVGYELLCKRVQRTQNCYNQWIEQFCSFENENYDDTVRKGIPAFFLHYDARYAPADTVITMDYPVIGNLRRRQGILAVEEYVGKIQLEQIFFKRLSKEFCYRALQEYQEGYRQQFYNICSIILRSIVVRKCCREERYQENPIRLREYFQTYEKEKLQELFHEILHQLVAEGYGGSQILENYLWQDLAEFVVELKC